MTSPDRAPSSLVAAIRESLRIGEMSRHFPALLLTADHTRLRVKDEGAWWDYKEQLDLENPVGRARIAKLILALHNTHGGAIIVGVTSDYRVPGLRQAQVYDKSIIWNKLREYIGQPLALFQGIIDVPGARFIHVLFVPKCTRRPLPVAANGPTSNGHPVIRRGEFYFRDNDQVRLIVDPESYQRVFGGVGFSISAYTEDVDEQFFRLLTPDYDAFVGRQALLSQLRAALATRHPIVTLDGLGGIGKTALAVKYARGAYDACTFEFIISVSAKARIWDGHAIGRAPGFAGLRGLLETIAAVLGIVPEQDADDLKRSVVEAMTGLNGLLLVDNLEDVPDPDVLGFLSLEVPAPVKVLATSRIDRGLGGLVMSVHEMDDEEARELLRHELARCEVPGVVDDDPLIQSVLAASGRVPLAIRWAAHVVAAAPDRQRAAARLIEHSGQRRELLSFCLTTMFDALPKDAREAALLYPYLAGSWNEATVGLALGLNREQAATAIAELGAKGIVAARGALNPEVTRVLPLITDFLADRWKANRTLQTRVLRAIADALPSHGGLFIEWPRERARTALCGRAIALVGSGDLVEARKLVRVGLSFDREDARLKFVEGWIDYKEEHYSIGLEKMRVAWALLEAGEATFEERWVFVRALINHGNAEGQREAVQVLEDMLVNAEHVPAECVRMYCDMVVTRRIHKSLRFVFSRVDSATRAFQLMNALGEYRTDPSLTFSWGMSFIRVWRLALDAEDLGPDLRRQWKQECSALEGRMKILQ